jgi:hypothetical protein
MGAEANGEETIDETQEVQEGQEEVPLNEITPEDVEDGAGDAETEDDTPPAADATEARIKELEERLAAQDVDFKLRLAGARNVKAAQALLADHDGDVDALKAAEPWLFETSQQVSKPKGKTGLPSAGAAVDSEKQLKHWREVAGLGE